MMVVFSIGATPYTTISFDVKFNSMDYHVHEEMLVVDEIGLIGNLGGSLGLFVGFSFFGYISLLFDLIWERIISKNWSLIEHL